MKRKLGALIIPALLGCILPTGASAQATAGTATINVTIQDYTGSSGQSHYAVAWVTTESGTFIKSLRKQGPTWSSSQWSDHCGTWNSARAGSTVLDGYTSATAANYTGTNSPIIQRWNGKDAAGTLMPDGNYKFWVQYAENSGQGPYTTSGLLWTKGANAATNTYPNQGVNFASMKVTWVPNTPPTITSAAPPAAAIAGVVYNHTVTATGMLPITFSATGLPPGLNLSTAGSISGIPTAGGTFSGTISAGNGTLPDAVQPFSITVSIVPARIASVAVTGPNLVVSGSGPANGLYSLMQAQNPDAGAGQWVAVGSGTFDASGTFHHTNAINSMATQQFYRLRVP